MPNKIVKITTAGSVDDGKSTLLARLMLDTGSFFTDQLENDLYKENIADLIDGLESERSQGITIDVANRFLDLEDTRFHFRDAPGHEQYTRNLATACAGSDALILLVDPREGLKPQTRLHLEIALMFGIKQVLVAVSKMDLVRYSQKLFSDVRSQVEDFISSKDMEELQMEFVPVSGQTGQGIVKKGRSLGWYRGPTLVELMANLKPSETGSYEMPIVIVENVQRPDDSGRHYFASLISGSVSKGMLLTDGNSAVELKSVGVFGSNREEIKAPAQFDFQTIDEVDLDTGAVLALPSVSRTNSVSARIVWFSRAAGLRGRSYLLQLGHWRSRCTISRLESLDTKSAEVRSIQVNSVMKAQLNLSESIPFFRSDQLAELSRGIIVDPSSGETAGAVIFEHSLRRGENVVPHSFQAAREERETSYGSKAKVVWFTGLSGSGKSTLADRLSVNFLASGRPHVILDGDSIRRGLNSDLGFTEQDRSENIRRVAEVAKVLVQSGITAVVSLVSPLRFDRYSAKEIIGSEDFIEVFVDTPLEICAARDPKGLYAKAEAGLIPNFTGVSASYEIPEHPDIHLDGSENLDQLVEILLAKC